MQKGLSQLRILSEARFDASCEPWKHSVGYKRIVWFRRGLAARCRNIAVQFVM